MSVFHGFGFAMTASHRQILCSPIYARVQTKKRLRVCFRCAPHWTFVGMNSHQSCAFSPRSVDLPPAYLGPLPLLCALFRHFPWLRIVSSIFMATVFRFSVNKTKGSSSSQYVHLHGNLDGKKKENHHHHASEKPNVAFDFWNVFSSFHSFIHSFAWFARCSRNKMRSLPSFHVSIIWILTHASATAITVCSVA